MGVPAARPQVAHFSAEDTCPVTQSHIPTYAGVGNVALMDSALVIEEDLGGQFFLGEEDVGKHSRAEASVAGLQVIKKFPFFRSARRARSALSRNLSLALFYELMISLPPSVTFSLSPELPPLHPPVLSPSYSRAVLLALALSLGRAQRKHI